MNTFWDNLLFITDSDYFVKQATISQFIHEVGYTMLMKDLKEGNPSQSPYYIAAKNILLKDEQFKEKCNEVF